jgi:CheY-like chemotaxis protein
MQQKPFARLSALVADNSPQMADLIAVMLRGLGLRQVTTVADATAAFKLLRTRRFDVLVLADDLAGMGGTDLTRRLRLSQGHLNQRIAVIMMSVEPNAVSLAAARDAGITEFLRKPFSAEHSAGRLESILKTPRDLVARGNLAGPDRRRRKAAHTGTERRA